MTEAGQLTAEQHGALGVKLFNSTWTMMELPERTQAQDYEMLHMAHASRHHWGQVGQLVHFARGEWQISRVYSLLGRAELCLHHAQRVLDICMAEAIGDWDLAFAYEALARGHAVAGDQEAVTAMLAKAHAAAANIKAKGDRDHTMSELATIPTG
jgi:hypothetical protein